MAEEKHIKPKSQGTNNPEILSDELPAYVKYLLWNEKINKLYKKLISMSKMKIK
jgi:hypothetical protein